MPCDDEKVLLAYFDMSIYVSKRFYYLIANSKSFTMKNLMRAVFDESFSDSDLRGHESNIRDYLEQLFSVGFLQFKEMENGD